MNEKELIHILFENTYINFLIGAGASYSNVDKTFPLMKDLLQYVIDEKEVKKAFNSFKSSKFKNNDTAKMIVSLFNDFLYSENGNIEKFLSVIDGVDFYANDPLIVENINQARQVIKQTIKKRIMSSDINSVIEVYLQFYKGLKCLKEVNGLKDQTFNIFTTNYDMMNEIAMEQLNLHFYSGFEGIVDRKFNLSYYNYNFVDHFLFNKSHVKTIPNHINLFKLHGSLSWFYEDNQLKELNPYIIDFEPEIIYPSVEKYNNTNLIINYSSLMREFSNRICKSNTTLFVSGMSMGDEHINKIIENALTLDSFHLVIFCATESLIETLKIKYELYNNVLVVSDVIMFDGVANLLINLNAEELN